MTTCIGPPHHWNGDRLHRGGDNCIRAAEPDTLTRCFITKGPLRALVAITGAPCALHTLIQHGGYKERSARLWQTQPHGRDALDRPEGMSASVLLMLLQGSWCKLLLHNHPQGQDQHGLAYHTSSGHLLPVPRNVERCSSAATSGVAFRDHLRGEG